MLHPATLRLIATRNQAGNPAKLLAEEGHSYPFFGPARANPQATGSSGRRNLRSARSADYAFSTLLRLSMTATRLSNKIGVCIFIISSRWRRFGNTIGSSDDTIAILWQGYQSNKFRI
jgi:hypothetical protein